MCFYTVQLINWYMFFYGALIVFFFYKAIMSFWICFRDVVF